MKIYAFTYSLLLCCLSNIQGFPKPDYISAIVNELSIRLDKINCYNQTQLYSQPPEHPCTGEDLCCFEKEMQTVNRECHETGDKGHLKQQIISGYLAELMNLTANSTDCSCETKTKKLYKYFKEDLKTLIFCLNVRAQS